MANEHIGRLRQIGFSFETTPGTGVAPAVWLEKVTGALIPVTDTVENTSSKGTIGARVRTQKVRKSTKLPFSGFARTTDLGYLLKALFGSVTLTVPCTLSGVAGGTPAVGDSVSIASPAMTGTIKYIAEGVYHIKILTGAFTASSNATTMTNGTWTATVGGIDNAIFSHVFERAENNNHPAATLYGYDPVDPQKSTYNLLSNLEINIASDNIIEISGEFEGQKIEDDATGSTPSYVDQFDFIGRQTTVKLGDAISDLDAATAAEMSRFKISVAKNLAKFQRLGSDEDTSIHNQQWDMMGDFDALFNSLTFRDYDINNTAKAMRVYVNASDFVIGTAGSPKLLIDISEAQFKEFTVPDGNDELLRQTLGYVQNEKADDDTSLVVVAVLTNDKSTTY